MKGRQLTEEETRIVGIELVELFSGKSREELLAGCMGGRLWEKGDKRQVYFNDTGEWGGFRCGYYKTGNIMWAELDGEVISNSLGREYESFFRNSLKVWYDLSSHKWGFKLYDHSRRVDAEALAECIVDALDARLTELLEGSSGYSD